MVSFRRQIFEYFYSANFLILVVTLNLPLHIGNLNVISFYLLVVLIFIALHSIFTSEGCWVL